MKITQPLSNITPAAGNAGGDLGGTLPGPTVVGIQGTPVCVTAPTLSQVLTFDGAEWCPAALPATTLTVKEIDGSPSVAATEIDVPNGSLSVAGTVATLAYVTPANGGLENITAHGNTGATETFFAAGEGNVHTATRDVDSTYTFAAVTSGKACSFTMVSTKDGTATPRLVTWPGSTVWQGGTAPVLGTAANAVDVLTFFTLDGGTVWYGFHAGAGAALTIKDEGTPLATDATSLDFVGAGVVASGATAAKTITISGAPTGAAGGDLAGTYPNPTIVPAVITALLPPAHVHVDNVTFSGDAIATVWELPAAPVDAYSVAAYVNGARVDMTLSGALLTTMTFGTAPGTGTDNIRVDIGAALA